MHKLKAFMGLFVDDSTPNYITNVAYGILVFLSIFTKFSICGLFIRRYIYYAETAKPRHPFNLIPIED